MAKGIRSKSQRKNRSLIRKTVSEPIMRVRQEAMAAALKKELEEKRGSSLKDLKSKIPGGKVQIDGAVEENSDDDQEDEETGKEEKKKFSFLRKTTGKKGSKPRNNPGKELTWF
jgi:hypothetical protein